MIQISKAHKRIKIDQGLFIIDMLPLGNALSNHSDHGIFQLGRLDHATLHPGVVVRMHLHRDDEILSYMRKGTMHHKDSNGNDIAINNQYLMMMNAGSGFYHEESVHDDAETVEMLQIFFRPRKDGLAPNVQFHQFEEDIKENEWRWIGGNETSDAPLKINSEVSVYDTLLKKSSLDTPMLKENKVGFVYVFDGQAQFGDDTIIEKGDSIYFDEPIHISTDQEAILVYIALDKEAAFSKNGLYAK